MRSIAFGRQAWERVRRASRSAWVSLSLPAAVSDDRLKRILGVFGKSLTLSNGKDGHRKPKHREVMAGRRLEAHGLD